MLLSLRRTTLEKAPEAKNAESKVKSALELKNFHYSSFLFPLPFSLEFWQFFCHFMQLEEILMRRERMEDLILTLGSIGQILCDLAF